MIEQRLSDSRGLGDHGWLHSRHTFSFANYWDPKQTGFSDLLVINDDQVAGGRGFGAHTHIATWKSSPMCWTVHWRIRTLWARAPS